MQKAYNPGGTTLRFDIARPDNFEAETLWDHRAVRAGPAGARAERVRQCLLLRDEERAARETDRHHGPGRIRGRLRRFVQCPQGAQLWAGGGARLAAEPPPLVTLRARAASHENPEVRGRICRIRRQSIWPLAASQRVGIGRIGRPCRGSGFRRRRGTTAPISATTTTARARWSRAATIADARAEYRLRRITLSAYLRNLFDNFAYIERDSNTAVLEDPREVGVGIEARF